MKATENTITFTSQGTDTVLKKLPAGNYTLTETTAPDGYTKAESIDFTVNEDGTITVGTSTVDKVTMEDAKISATISKVDVSNGNKELEGATLTITSKDGKDLSNVTSENTTMKASKTDVTFVSQATDTVLSNLPAGEYTLTETTAPDGYTKAESIDFTVNEDGTITVGGSTVDKVTMEDKQISVDISKVDITNNIELQGATIQVISKDNLDLSNVTSSNNKLTISDNKHVIEFTSLNMATKLEKLPAGTYTLVETSAPNCYTKA